MVNLGDWTYLQLSKGLDLTESDRYSSQIKYYAKFKLPEEVKE